MKKTICIFLFFIALSGCKGKAPGASQTDLKNNADGPSYGDALIEGTIGEPSILIPMLASDTASHNVSGLIFNGLVKYDTDLSVIGDLANRGTSQRMDSSSRFI
jgi:peptide/nickel transport system substrate-binding protein